jgi:Ni,Fe-hydrogenase III large subunit
MATVRERLASLIVMLAGSKVTVGVAVAGKV